LLHTGTEVLVGGGRERAGGCHPLAIHSRASLKSSVCRLVVTLLGTGRGSAGQLLGKVAEVLLSLDLVAINGYQP
jgi:hypothetical protein